MASSLDQCRALLADERVVGISDLEAADLATYGRYVKSTPAMVRQIGLGQALAFLMSRNDTAAWRLIDDLHAWLAGDAVAHYWKGGKEAVKTVTNGRTLLATLCNQPQAEYRLLQEEALLFLEWLKRLAVVEIAGLVAKASEDRKGS